MPKNNFVTKQQINDIWGVLKRQQVIKSFSTGRARVSLSSWTALGDGQDERPVVFCLTKTSFGFTKYALPNDEPEVCKKVCVVFWIRDWGKNESVVTNDSKKFRKKAIKAAKENFFFDIDALDESLTEQSWSVLFSSAQNLFKTHTQENEKLIFQAYGIENPNDFSIIPAAIPAKTTTDTRIDQTSPRLDQAETNQTESDQQQTSRLEDVGTRKTDKDALEQNRERKEGPKDTMASTTSPSSATKGSTNASDGQHRDPDIAQRVQHQKKPAEKKRSRRIHSDRRTSSPKTKRRTSKEKGGVCLSM